MNKADLISAVSTAEGLSKVQTGKIINTIFNAVKGALNSGEKVTLIGFGTFQTADRKARKGRNPKTGAEILIPEKTVAKFRPGRSLSESVNGSVSAE